MSTSSSSSDHLLKKKKLEDETITQIAKKSKHINLLTTKPGDLQNSLNSDWTKHPREPLVEHQKNTKTLTRKDLEQGFTATAIDLLEDLGNRAYSQGLLLYAVGGIVRDILLNSDLLSKPDIDISSPDIDLLVVRNPDKELNADFSQAKVLSIEFVDYLARTMKLPKPVHHESFLTATLTFPAQKLKLDFAQARKEIYPFPSSLPEVQPAETLEDDLCRRDFTLNALAVSLNPNNFGEIQDYYQGLEDLRSGVLRVFHSLSFFEDPTRLWRLVRFETRLGFKVEELTENTAELAIKTGFAKKISPARVFTEVKRLTAEPNPDHSFQRLLERDWISLWIPSLDTSSCRSWKITQMKNFFQLWTNIDNQEILPPKLKQLALLQHGKKPVEMSTRWKFYLLGLGHAVHDFDKFLKELQISEGHTKELLTARNDAKTIFSSLTELSEEIKQEKYSCIHRVLKGKSLESIVYAGALLEGDLQIVLSWYLKYLSAMKIEISGRELKDAHYQPGPLFAQALEQVLAAKLDSEVNTPSEQLQLAINFLEKNNAKKSK